MERKIKYGKHQNNAVELVVFAKTHGTFKVGDKAEVHPNNAILLRSKGIVKDDTKIVKQKTKK